MFGVGKEAQLIQEAGLMVEQVKTLLARSVTVNLLLRAKKELQDKVRELEGITDAKWRDKAGSLLAEHADFLMELDSAVDNKLQLEALNELAAKTSAHLLAIETSLVDGQVAKAKVQFSVLAGRSQKLWTKENLTNFPAIQRLAIRFREVKRNIQALADVGDVGSGSVQGDTSRTTSRTSASAGAFSSSASQLGDGRSAVSAGGSSSVLSASGPANDSGPIENVFWSALQHAKRGFGKDTAMYCGAKRLSLTWAEVAVSSEAFASYLISLGVGTTDVVCIASLHSTHHCQLVAMGTLLAGARVGAVNYRMDASMMAHQITTLAPRVLVVDDVLVPLAKVGAKLAKPPVLIFAGVGEPPVGAIDISVALGYRAPVPIKDWKLPAGHSMQVGVFFTAGPTPMDLPVALAVKVKHVLTITRDVHFSPEDVVYRGIPVYHFSFLALLLITASSGCASVCLRERISGPTLLKLLRVCKATAAVSPLAPMLDSLKDVPKGDKDSTVPKLKYIFSGPAKPSPEASSALQAFFPSASVMEGFGLLPQGTLRRTYSNLSFGSLEGASFIEERGAAAQDASPSVGGAAARKKPTVDSSSAANSPNSPGTPSLRGRAVAKTGSTPTLPLIGGKPPSSTPSPIQAKARGGARFGDEETLPNSVPEQQPLPGSPAVVPKPRAASAVISDNLGRMATSLPVARVTSATPSRATAASVDDTSLKASATSPARLSPNSTPVLKREAPAPITIEEYEGPTEVPFSSAEGSSPKSPSVPTVASVPAVAEAETKAERKAREKREAADAKKREKEAKEEAKRREKEEKEEAKRREKEERQRAKEGK